MEIELAPVRQHISTERVADTSRAVRDGLAALPLASLVRPGMRIAIALPSRGIPCLPEIVRTLVQELVALRAAPFLVPAMGSHGGGTEEGQREVLEAYGLGEDALGIPIRSSMETVVIGHTADGMPVYMDAHAASADGIIPVNRVKEHTAFKGLWESGLCKILAVGLGKERGAAEIHGRGVRDAMPAAARVVLAKKPVLGGIAIVENGQHEPARIVVLSRERIESDEPALLDLARRLMPRIPHALEPLDLLLVQEMGKDLSGTGMDLNVIGMWRRAGGPVEPDIRTIAALDLTANSHGNAIGVGYADLIPQRLADKIDRAATYKNCLTARNMTAAKLPITLPTDRDVFEAALAGQDPTQARVLYVKNTLALDILWVSPALVPSLAADPCLEPLGPGQTLRFDATGNLTEPRTA